MPSQHGLSRLTYSVMFDTLPNVLSNVTCRFACGRWTVIYNTVTQTNNMCLRMLRNKIWQCLLRYITFHRLQNTLQVRYIFFNFRNFTHVQYFDMRFNFVYL